jgi:hypothetical protein
MRGVVAIAATLAFGAGLILDPAGVVRMALFAAAGGFGAPGRAVVLGLGAAMAALAVRAVLRRRMARRTVVAGRGSRSARPPQVRALQVHPSSSKPAKAPAPRPARTAARPARQARRKG